jgi:hypothetical protein
MIRTNVLAIRVALITCSIATFVSSPPARGQTPAGQAPAAPAQPAPGRGGRGQTPPTPQAPPTPQKQAPIDLTGWWVSVVTEDWRWRMVTPPKGDYASVPINAEGRRVADTWDPVKDKRDGNACRAYGVGGIMRVPGRLHITWQGEDMLKIETDAGTQTRLLRFAPPDESSADVALGLRAAAAPPPAGEQGWQGYSVATWDILNPPIRGNPLLAGTGAPAAGGADGAGGTGRGRGGNAPPVTRYGSLKVITTKMKPGYLRNNGVPYSEKATVTEYFDRHKESDGDEWLTVTTLVEDPKYLNQTFITSSHFKKEPDGSKWRPTTCAAQ